MLIFSENEVQEWPPTFTPLTKSRCINTYIKLYIYILNIPDRLMSDKVSKVRFYFSNNISITSIQLLIGTHRFSQISISAIWGAHISICFILTDSLWIVSNWVP